jgi:hypothetical protein
MISDKRTDSYTLYKDHHGEWIIEMLCGGIGMYVRRLKLNSEEIGMIEEWGDYYVEKIALDLAKEPSRFVERLRERWGRTRGSRPLAIARPDPQG